MTIKNVAVEIKCPSANLWVRLSLVKTNPPQLVAGPAYSGQFNCLSRRSSKCLKKYKGSQKNSHEKMIICGQLSGDMWMMIGELKMTGDVIKRSTSACWGMLYLVHQYKVGSFLQSVYLTIIKSMSSIWALPVWGNRGVSVWEAPFWNVVSLWAFPK